MEELAKSQLADFLRKLMRKKKLNGAQLAEKAGLSKSAVSNYLGGKAVPNLESREALAKVLGVTADKLELAADDDIEGAIYSVEWRGGKARVKLHGLISVDVAAKIQELVRPFLAA